MPVDDAGEDSEGGIGAKMRKIFANRKNLSAADRKRLGEYLTRWLNKVLSFKMITTLRKSESCSF